MYIFLGFIAVAVVAGVVVFYKENKKSAKIRQEKADGKWDFIEMEYQPYLQSQGESVHETGILSFKVLFDSYTWDLSGSMHYNAAGIYAQFDAVLDSAPRFLFIWGKDQPTRFCPASSLHFHSVDWKGRDFLVNLKTREDKKQPDYIFIIKNATDELVDELQKVFPSAV